MNVEFKDLEKLTNNLKNTSRTAYPLTVRSTLNAMAKQTRDEYKSDVPKTFMVRNRGYLKTIGYDNCKNTFKIEEMESAAGQREHFFGKTMDGLRKQEYGETIKSKSKHIAKPTKFARGGQYKRLVRNENFMSAIKVSRISDLVKYPAKTEFREFRQAVAVAKRQEKTINFLPSSESYFGINGIAQIDGSKSKSVNYLYSLKDKEQPLKKTPVLKPAGERVAAKGGEIYVNEAKRRMEKELAKGLKK